MDRYVLSDAQWAKMQPHCLGKKSDPGRSGEDNRRFVEAVLWIARTGSPWRDLPPLFGPWNTVFKRYRDWVKADVFKRLFDAVSEEPDMEYAMVDATIVKSLPRRRPGSTATDKAQKGDSKPGHRQIQGRHDDQNPGPHRRPGQPRPIRAAAGTALRYRRCSAAHRGDRIRRADRRQGLRQQRHHRRSQRAGRQDRDFSASPPQRAAANRHRDVQMASSHRELLL